jgi:hypothetical protein
MIWFRRTVMHAFGLLAQLIVRTFNRAAKRWLWETFTAYFACVRLKFKPLMIVILFSFLGYNTSDIGSNFA